MRPRNGPTQNETAPTLKRVGGGYALRALTETSALQNRQRSTQPRTTQPRTTQPRAIQPRSTQPRAIQQRVIPTTTRNVNRAAGGNASRTTPSEATASNVRASPAMTHTNGSVTRVDAAAASGALARLPPTSTANRNSVAHAPPTSVNRPRLSDFEQLKSENEQLKRKNEQLLRSLNEKSAQLEDAKIEISGINSKVKDLETRLENDRNSAAEKAVEMQLACEKRATEARELETISSELLFSLEAKAAHVQDAHDYIHQLECALECLENRPNSVSGTMECPFAAPEESQTELIQPEELIEDLLQELGSKTTELYQAQEQICKLEAEAQVLRKMRPGNEDGNMAYLISVELKHFSGVQVQAAILKWELKIRTTVAGKPFGRYQVETDSDKANSSNGPITPL